MPKENLVSLAKEGLMRGVAASDPRAGEARAAVGVARHGDAQLGDAS